MTGAAGVRHELPTPWGLRAAGWTLVAGELVGITMLVRGTRDNPGLMVASLVPFLVGFGVAWVCLRARIVVATDPCCVSFAFAPLYRRVVPADEVAATYLHEHLSPARFAGVGLRRMPGRVTALLWGAGPGVEVVTTGGEHVIAVLPQAADVHAHLPHPATGGDARAPSPTA